MSRGWHRALAFAVTGERLEVSEPDAPRPAALVADLAALGWDADTVAEHALAAIADGRPWPHPVPDDLREGLGAAQLHAALGGVRAGLGLDVLERRPPSRRTRLDADERRLMADVPPHFGRS